MEVPEAKSPTRSPETLATGLKESLPLIAVSLMLFAAGFLASANRIAVGPSHLPLFLPLVMLGFVAAIGAVLSWFFAGRPAPSPPPRETSAPPLLPSGRSPDEGRPRPRVAVDREVVAPPPPPEPAPWDEGTLELETPGYFGRSPQATAAEAQAALEELDGLAQEVKPRRRRDPSDEP